MNASEMIKMADSDNKVVRGDTDLYGVVKQVCEITGSSHDVAATTLFDCNYDVERAINKIFERCNDGKFEERRSDVWKEVAKVRRKGTIEVFEDLKSEIKVEDSRGRGGLRNSGRGRSRGGRIGGEFNMRGSIKGRGKWTQNSRGNLKPRIDQNAYQSFTNDGYVKEKENPICEWIVDDHDSEIMVGNECDISLSKITLVDENPVEIVAKYSNKDGVFGDFSKTKAPPPSSILATAPIKLVTSAGIMSLPSSTFHFGLDFSEYCTGNNEIKSSRKIIDDIKDSNNVEDNCKKLSESDENYKPISGGYDEIERGSGCQETIRRSQNGLGDNLRVQVCQDNSRILGDIDPCSISLPVKENHKDIHKVISPVTSFSSSPPKNNSTDPSDISFSAMLPSSPQLCPPPGMSHAHILQQLHNNSPYLSLMNLPGGLFDLVSTSSDNTQLMHSVDSKELLSKTMKANEHDNTAVINAMQMQNICCFSPMYMNNFANYLSTIPGHNPQGESSQQQSSAINPSLLTLTSSSGAHRNYTHDEFAADTGKYDDVVTSGKHKYMRTPNYVNSYTSGNGVTKDDSQHEKGNGRQSTGSTLNRSGQPQQAVSNDPRFLTFHQPQQSHPYPNNIYNCVTAPGTHTSGPHPYATAHQAGGIQQLHLLQQQMHNFPQSYQFQEHLMASLVPNGGNSRANGGSNGSQSTRSSRSNNTMWHSSNQ